ncbi:MAG: ABC transporter ATP-binding protein [Bacteroidota bacterium]
MNQQSFLSVNNLFGKIGENNAINDISFVLNEGEKLAIAGETGSGKTTLLKMLSGFLQPEKGEILFKGEKVKGPNEQLIAGHPKIAYLSQYFELRNNYYVRDFLEMAEIVSKEKAQLIYEICRIAQLLNRRTNALSGGERQRIALARLLITSPYLLLLDEPFSHLDFSHKEIIRQVLRDIEKEFGTSFILVSHDVSDLLSWADRLLIMKAGSIITENKPTVLFDLPLDSYCAGLTGPFSIISSELAKRLDPSLEVNPFCSYCLRPAQIQITNDTSFPKAEVSETIFFGNYYMISLLCNDEVIQMIHLTNEFQTDLKIHIRVRKGMSLKAFSM